MSAQDKETGAPSGVLTLKIDTSALQGELDGIRAQVEAYQAQHRRLVRALDVALNGETGAAPQASLCDLLAQVERQQAVQILNQPDGMRINFRAPDGRRVTLHIEAILNDPGAGPDHVLATMRAAVAAYPVAGVRPEQHSDAHDAAQVQALAGGQVHPESALPSVRGDE